MKNKYFLLVIIGLIWGSQFIFQKIALTALTPQFVGVGRAVVGFITLFIICKMLKVTSQGNTPWLIYMLIGLLEASIPFTLVPWGQQYVSSSIASVLIGTVPFFVILFTPLLSAENKISRSSILSVVVGFLGLLSLFAPDIIEGNSSLSVWGPLSILAASASFGVALLLLVKCGDEHPLIVARNVLGSASLQILLISIFTGSQIPSHVTLDSMLSIAYLGVMCAGVVYFLYMILISEAGPVFTSLTNYLVPTFGVLIGVMFAHEQVGLNTWIALAMILIAVAFNQREGGKEEKVVVVKD
ncbi:DMT family transporter [Vibrio alginolyticus]|uniref:DMT family transporter n=1 Tax=Vibrio alginolyticus TaxID=663 RepID=UPI00215BB64D|nr:EamA family transporter [Vibrio alginolyticus]EJE3288757.1 EamA family transporter [Vibrio alginolyticus]EJI1384562.1 EamA family transporter [Vibrio alginolyticus]ELA8470381.1 EamA family transporter [Vibrio alginolyticus]ELP9500905.1 EamA family transporter [Vibrio alginolyticus]MCR9504441.1 EamA family transporter [Vibrio alginolyticus]